MLTTQDPQCKDMKNWALTLFLDLLVYFINHTDPKLKNQTNKQILSRTLSCPTRNKHS